MIVAEGGGFPKTVSALRKIRGIGDYTAGAIASIAFEEVGSFWIFLFFFCLISPKHHYSRFTISGGASG